MKKILLSIQLLALVCATTGCYTNIIDTNEIGGGGNGGGEDDVQLTIPDRSQLKQHIGAESRVCEVEFSANTGWYTEIITADALDWISLFPESSEYGGPQTLHIFVEENTTGYERTASINLRCGNTSEEIAIAQSSVRSDGTQPEPFVPDSYTDFVGRITIQYLQDQWPGAPSFEWRFGVDEQQSRVYRMQYYEISGDTETLYEEYNLPEPRHIERQIYGFDMHGIFGLTINELIEMNLNAYGFVRSQWTLRAEYGRNEDTGPIRFQTAYSYSDYLLTQAQTDNTNIRYDWLDGNMVRLWEQYFGQEPQTRNTCAYTDQPNDRANIDLNALLDSDMRAAIGLLGKRSRNLISSRSDPKGTTDIYEYAFDPQGRVTTITHRIAYDGTTLPVALYTIEYTDNSSK